MNHTPVFQPRTAAVAMLALAVLAVATTHAQTPTLRPVALTGTDGPFGPGLGVGVTFSQFTTADLGQFEDGTPTLNGAGQSIFLATLSGPGIVPGVNDTGIWTDRGGSLTLLARTGDPAPDTAPGVTFAGFFRQPLLSDSGKAAFMAVITGPGVTNDNNDGLWTEGPGTVSLLIRENTTPVPGGGGLFFANPNFPGDPQPRMWVGLPVINAAGHVAARVIINTPTVTLGLYTDQSGALQEIVRMGDPVPGLVPPRTFVNVGTPALSDNGAVTFRMQTSTPFPQFEGVWTNRSGSLTPVAMSGDLAPGTATQFANFSLNQGINGSDRIAFEAGLATGGGFDAGIWSEGLFGVIQPIAITGAPAPGMPSVFFDFGSQFDNPIVSDSGTTAFLATVNLANLNRGVWSNRPGFLELVAGAGNLVPGVPGQAFVDFFALAIGATGEVAFFSTTSSGKVFCRQSTTGALDPIAATFTPLDLFGDGSDVRLITDVVIPSFSFVGDPPATGTGDGHRIALNDAGDVAVRLAFSDGTEGLFTTAPAPVTCTAADVNNDGTVDGSDIGLFVSLLINQNGTAQQICAGDLQTTPNGSIGLEDVANFAACLLAGGC